MNRTVKTLAAAALALGLAFTGTPLLTSGGGMTTMSGGGTGCCKQ
ncbi:MAG: hypothetical protein JWP95_2217 [Actinotalea sp.]|nr:hypothetical protein [Actinotalea sp.]